MPRVMANRLSDDPVTRSADDLTVAIGALSARVAGLETVLFEIATILRELTQAQVSLTTIVCDGVEARRDASVLHEMKPH